MPRTNAQIANPVTAVIISRNMGSSAAPNCEIIAVSNESMDTSAAVKFTAFAAERTGLLYLRYFTTLITEEIIGDLKDVLKTLNKRLKQQNHIRRTQSLCSAEPPR